MKKMLLCRISIIVLFLVMVMIPVSALPPSADSLEVEAASGKSGTYIEVPVKIENVTNASVLSIRLKVDYNENVLTLTGISSGDLTSTWGIQQLGKDRHTVTIATINTEYAIPIGRSGSVVLLNFHVIGTSGDTSLMDLSLVELSDPNGEIGTAPAKNGKFIVESSNGGVDSGGDGGSGGGGGVSRSTPTPTSTEKPPAVSQEDKVVKLPEPHSPTLAPTVTSSSEAPLQTNASATPELPAKAEQILVIVVIAVPIIAVIIYVVFKRRKK